MTRPSALAGLVCLPVLAGVCPISSALGAESAPVQPVAAAATPAFTWTGYFEAIGLMLLLLGGLWLVTWLFRRYGRSPLSAAGSFPRGGLRMETQLPLGPRRGLVVVRFLDQRLLLGVTEHQITLLDALPLPPEAPDAPADARGDVPAPRPRRQAAATQDTRPPVAQEVSEDEAEHFASLLSQARSATTKGRSNV